MSGTWVGIDRNGDIQSACVVEDGNKVLTDEHARAFVSASGLRVAFLNKRNVKLGAPITDYESERES